MSALVVEQLQLLQDQLSSYFIGSLQQLRMPRMPCMVAAGTLQGWNPARTGTPWSFTALIMLLLTGLRV